MGKQSHLRILDPGPSCPVDRDGDGDRRSARHEPHSTLVPRVWRRHQSRLPQRAAGARLPGLQTRVGRLWGADAGDDAGDYAWSIRPLNDGDPGAAPVDGLAPFRGLLVGLGISIVIAAVAWIPARALVEALW